VGLVVGVLALAPWLWRNYRVAGTPLGLARYGLVEGTGRGTERVVRVGQAQRTFAAPGRLNPRMVLRKALMNGRELYETTVKDIGANYLVIFFLVALLHRFRRLEVLQVRRLVWWSLVGYGAWVCVAGPPRREALTLFAPLIILYGAAFFYVMFERLQFRTRARRSGTVGLFVAINLVPFGLAVLPPRDTSPYPPYEAQVVTHLGRVFRPDEVLASDIPWAVAWYADRTTVWAPLEQRDYMQIHDNVHTIAGVYVTQATLQGQTVMEMFAGYQQLWWRLFLFQTPPDFPLRQFRALTPDGQQVLISNRPL
jgi:hypothetical protein